MESDLLEYIRIVLAVEDLIHHVIPRLTVLNVHLVSFVFQCTGSNGVHWGSWNITIPCYINILFFKLGQISSKKMIAVLNVLAHMCMLHLL